MLVVIVFASQRFFCYAKTSFAFTVGIANNTVCRDKKYRRKSVCDFIQLIVIIKYEIKYFFSFTLSLWVHTLVQACIRVPIVWMFTLPSIFGRDVKKFFCCCSHLVRVSASNIVKIDEFIIRLYSMRFMVSTGRHTHTHFHM